MPPIHRVAFFLDRYKKIRKLSMRLVSVISADLIDWRYKPGKFSIADHLRHIAAIERFMFAEVLQDKPSAYEGCGNELAEDLASILVFLEKCHLETLSIVARLNDKDMDSYCRSPGGIPVQKEQWLWMLAEHEIHHRAELYIYLNILGKTTPPMYGLSSEALIRSGKNN